MGVSPKILKAHGCTPKDWKPKFEASDPAKKSSKIKKLELLIQNRNNDGQLKNIAEYRTFAAIDMAYDAPFAQTTPTIIQNLMGRKWDKTEDILAELQHWGLREEEIFLKTTLPNGQPGWILNPPTFYKVLIPLMKAYITIRWAKLFNDRNTNPLLPYEPMEPDDVTRVQCAIITSIMQVMTADYGYQNMLKDAIFQTLMYATCLAFPMEVWHSDKHTETVDGKEKDVTQKEGIRYSLPHPTRMFWDLAHPIYTFNTDSGCEFAGYWKVVRYGDILDNKNYWNRRQIGYSGKQWGDPAFSSNFFQEVYPCRLEWPVPGATGMGTSREAAAMFYASNQRDMAVSETNLFMKLVPAQWDLGTYKHPIWIRFVVASDNTVIYAEPSAYSPILYSGYDSNSLRSKNSSMALEILPTQDIVGNILSQILLTTKQNLANVIFYDINVVDQTEVDRLKNSGEILYRGMNLIPFDSRKTAIAGLNIDKAFNNIQFQWKDCQPLFQSFNVMLNMLERLLQVSSQEAGAAASHQQSKAEIDLIGSSTSNRVTFTGSFIDDFVDALKWQLYEATIAYNDDEVEASIPGDIPNIEKIVAEIGFKIVGKSDDGAKLKVRGSKKHLKLNALAVSGKGPQKSSNPQVAQVMMQAISAIAANESLATVVGPKTLLKMLEKASILAGADKDFQLRPDQKAQLDQLQQMAQQIQIACARQAEDKIAKPAAEQMAKMQAEITTLSQAMENLIKQLGLGQTPPPDAAPMPTQPIADAAAGQPVETVIA